MEERPNRSFTSSAEGFISAFGLIGEDERKDAAVDELWTDRSVVAATVVVGCGPKMNVVVSSVVAAGVVSVLVEKRSRFPDEEEAAEEEEEAAEEEEERKELKGDTTSELKRELTEVERADGIDERVGGRLSEPELRALSSVGFLFSSPTKEKPAGLAKED